MLGHPMITFTTLVWLGRLKGKMFVPFNLFLRLTEISLRLAIQKTFSFPLSVHYWGVISYSVLSTALMETA